MTVTARRNITEIETYSGKYVDLLDPQPEQICLADIAVGLANTCRFGGQVTRFYSVAEHSVRCAEEAERRRYNPLLQIACLLHDAHEAYTGDLTSPLKALLGQRAPGVIPDIQYRLDEAIGARFEIDHTAFAWTAVKQIDDYMLFHEAAGLKYSHGIGEHWGNDEYHEPLVAYGWSPAEAERRFIECYERLSHAGA